MRAALLHSAVQHGAILGRLGLPLPSAGSPYDVMLEISDDLTKDPPITVKLNKELYGPKDAEVVMDTYLSILRIFSRDPALRVEDGRLDQGAKARA